MTLLETGLYGSSALFPVEEHDIIRNTERRITTTDVALYFLFIFHPLVFIYKYKKMFRIEQEISFCLLSEKLIFITQRDGVGSVQLHEITTFKKENFVADELSAVGNPPLLLEREGLTCDLLVGPKIQLGGYFHESKGRGSQTRAS